MGNDNSAFVPPRTRGTNIKLAGSGKQKNESENDAVSYGATGT
jgi:hypothetical protein